MGRRTRFALASVVALVAVLAFPQGAHAVGQLTPGGCIDDPTGPDLCAQSTVGLDSPQSVAVSPDGKSVYVVSRFSGALVRFDRAATGALTAAGCIEDNDSGTIGCARAVNGMSFASGVTVSPDGKSVYVAAADDDAIVRFNRSSTGALTPAGCVDDNDTGDDVCAQAVNGLDGAVALTVSADGKSVYVGAEQDGALVRFNRSSTGALTPAGCVDDNDTGDDVCAQSVNALEDPEAVAVSPDGKSVYVAGQQDDAIVRFDRSSTGALTPRGCINDTTGSDTCAESTEGLSDADGVAVSPDGKSVYVGASDDDAVVIFQRSSTGALTPAGCISDNDTGDPACQHFVDGLDMAIDKGSVAVSPDGASVYVVGTNDRALVRFNRGSNGQLFSGDCVEDNDTGFDFCPQAVNAMNFPTGVAVSPDGKSVYVVSEDDDAIVRFIRAT